MKRFEIASVVKDLGISAHLKGYHYIISAVQLLLESDKHWGNFMDLYHSVGEAFNKSAVSTERAMRNAISLCWNRANPETVKKMFRHGIGDEKPTVSEFVATIADYLSMAGDENENN